MNDRTTQNRWSMALALVLAACGGKTDFFDDGGDATADAPLDTADAPSDVTDAVVFDGRPDAPDYTSCAAPGDCTLVTPGCCQECGSPPLSSFASVRRDSTNAFHDAVCPVPTPCPKCASMTDPNYTAVCRGSRCLGVDLRTDVDSKCATDADCVLRFPGCCESCAGDPTQLLAVAKAGLAEYQQQLCGLSPPACPPCVPTYPAKAFARCEPTSKHCQVLLAP